MQYIDPNYDNNSNNDEEEEEEEILRNLEYLNINDNNDANEINKIFMLDKEGDRCIIYRRRRLISIFYMFIYCSISK